MYMITNGLRGTLDSVILESGHTENPVQTRAGHSDPRSLRSCQNLRGNEDNNVIL